MKKPKLIVFCHSNISHLRTIYTALQVLELEDKIDLDYVLGKTNVPVTKLSPASLLVSVNEKLVVFDMSDFGGVESVLVDQVDFYFKRSYSSNLILENQQQKVFPFGLYIKVHEQWTSCFSLRRTFLEETKTIRLKALGYELFTPFHFLNPNLFRLNFQNCSQKPDFSLDPGVIFMVTLWEPAETLPKYREEREAINEMRVSCIRKLREAFGNKFYGGVRYSEYSKKNAPDCLVDDPKSTIFKNYIRAMKKYPIGIASTGLHKSIGWKFAEYIAFSRAIVSERLQYEVPGLQVNKHYLEFSNPEECVMMVAKLMEDNALRNQMMADNYQFYLSNLKPDVQVWNALLTVLDRKGNHVETSPG